MLNWSFFLIMALVGWVAQFVDGTLGMGYGVFSTSMLIGLGLYPAIASASVHTAEIFTTLVSGVSHFGFGNVKRDLVLSLSLPGIAGGVLGAYCAASVPGSTIKPLVPSLLLAMGLVVIYRFLRKSPSQSADPDPGVAISTPRVGIPPAKLALLGFAAAFMDAVGGGGWGPIATPSLILSGDHETRQVVGSVNLAEFFVTLAEVLTFLVVLGPASFRWDIVLALLIGGAIAAPVAAFLCHRMPERMLGLLIGATLVALNLRTLLGAFLR